MDDLLIELGDQEIPFGKYKGETLNFIYEENKNYLTWLSNQEGLNSVIVGIYLAAQGE